MELDPEAIKWRRRTTYLLSLILHGVLVLILVSSPDLLRRGKRTTGIPVEMAPKKTIRFCCCLRKFYAGLASRHRKTRPSRIETVEPEGRSPVINPNGLHMPYSWATRRCRKLPVAKPPAAAPAPLPGNPGSAPPGPPGDQPSNQTPAPPTNDGLRLDEVKPTLEGEEEV